MGLGKKEFGVWNRGFEWTVGLGKQSEWTAGCGRKDYPSRVSPGREELNRRRGLERRILNRRWGLETAGVGKAGI